MRLHLPDGRLSEHFVGEEFKCRCDGKHGVECPGYPDPESENGGIDARLIELLERVRNYVALPIHVLSGYRCPAHNEAVSGATMSQHLLGRAADIVCRKVTPLEIASIIEFRFNPPGLGRYNTFVHVDTRIGFARWNKISR